MIFSESLLTSQLPLRLHALLDGVHGLLVSGSPLRGVQRRPRVLSLACLGRRTHVGDDLLAGSQVLLSNPVLDRAYVVRDGTRLVPAQLVFHHGSLEDQLEVSRQDVVYQLRVIFNEVERNIVAQRAALGLDQRLICARLVYCVLLVVLPEKVLSGVFDVIRFKKLLQFVAHLLIPLVPLVCAVGAPHFSLLFKLRFKII